MPSEKKSRIATRFRGYLPVIVDLETAGFDPKHNALLEIAAVILRMDDRGLFEIQDIHSFHVKPFEGSKLDQSALEFTGIDPYHPFRLAIDEKDALQQIFKPVRTAIKENGCTRAILVGHNPAFDISFLNAAVERTKIKRNPFHPFSTFDTATLSGLVYEQTVLARAAKASGLDWDNNEAHAARYDAEQTAQLFCNILNRWQNLLDLESKQDHSTSISAE